MRCFLASNHNCWRFMLIHASRFTGGPRIGVAILCSNRTALLFSGWMETEQISLI